MSETNDYHERQLEAAPGKVARMLNSIARDEAIRRALESIGLDAGERAEGRRRLMVTLGEVPVPPAPPTPAAKSGEEARKALTDLDQKDEGRVARVRAALTAAHPTLVDVVLKGVKAGTGAQAITCTSLLVQHIRALPTLGGEGVQARALLAKRGFTDAELTSMENQVNLALGAPEAAEGGAEAEAPPAPPVDLAERRAHQESLLAWWKDWSVSARTVITRRDQLISLGLVRRRSPQVKDGAEDGEETD